MADSGSISKAHADVHASFEGLIEALEHPAREFQDQFSLKDAQEELVKYKRWAGNVGAANSGRLYKISLDYRLREATVFKDQVLNLLHTLNEKLLNATALLRGERKPFEEVIEESDSETSGLSSTGGEDGENEESDDSPWEISSDSTRSGGSARPSTRAKMMASSSDAASISSRKKTTIMDLGRVPKAEMPRLRDSIRFTITCLYRIPIRKPAPLDRLKDKTSLNSSAYQHFDVLYVRDKFPDLDPVVAARLGKLITRRRQLLQYREEHQRRLEEPKEQLHRPIEHDSKPAVLPSQTEKGKKPDGSQAASSNRFTIPSKATTLRPRDVPFKIPHENFLSVEIYTPSVAESKTSVASSFATKDIHIDVPPRPKDDDGNELELFDCPYCFISQRITSHHRWKKHVFEDIQPYVCSYAECDLQDHFFDSRDTWFQHEEQHHRARWFCNIDKHPEFEDQADFLHHMEGEHNHKIDVTQLGSLKDMFRQPARRHEGKCNFCMRHSKKLKSHVSRHLQQMALFALPRANEATNSAKAEQDSQSRSLREHDHGKVKSTSQSTESISSVESEEDTPPHQETAHIQLSIDLPREDEVEVEEIPDGIETDWDIVTDKFSAARLPAFRPLDILVALRGVPSNREVGISMDAAEPSPIEKFAIVLLQSLGCNPRHTPLFRLASAVAKEPPDLIFVDGSATDESWKKELVIEFIRRAIDASGTEMPATFILFRADESSDLRQRVYKRVPPFDLFNDIIRLSREDIIELLRKRCNWEPPAFLESQKTQAPPSESYQASESPSNSLRDEDASPLPEPDPWLLDYANTRFTGHAWLLRRISQHMTLRRYRVRKYLQRTEVASPQSIITTSKAPMFSARYPWPFAEAPSGWPARCPYCNFIKRAPIIDVNSADSDKDIQGRLDNAWKQHMLEDLRPLVCLSQACRSPNVAYCSIPDWQDHMKSCDKPLWDMMMAQCPLCDYATPPPLHIAHHLMQAANFGLPDLTTQHENNLDNRSLSTRATEATEAMDSISEYSDALRDSPQPETLETSDIPDAEIPTEVATIDEWAFLGGHFTGRNAEKDSHKNECATSAAQDDVTKTQDRESPFKLSYHNHDQALLREQVRLVEGFAEIHENQKYIQFLPRIHWILEVMTVGPPLEWEIIEACLVSIQEHEKSYEVGEGVASLATEFHVAFTKALGEAKQAHLVSSVMPSNTSPSQSPPHKEVVIPQNSDELALKSTANSETDRTSTDKYQSWFCSTCGEGPYSTGQPDCLRCYHERCGKCRLVNELNPKIIEESRMIGQTTGASTDNQLIDEPSNQMFSPEGVLSSERIPDNPSLGKPSTNRWCTCTVESSLIGRHGLYWFCCSCGDGPHNASVTLRCTNCLHSFGSYIGD